MYIRVLSLVYVQQNAGNARLFRTIFTQMTPVYAATQQLGQKRRLVSSVACVALDGNRAKNIIPAVVRDASVEPRYKGDATPSSAVQFVDAAVRVWTPFRDAAQHRTNDTQC